MAGYQAAEYTGYQCPKCKKMCLSQCVEAKFTSYGKLRSRKCEYCGERFSTVEIIGDAMIVSAVEHVMRSIKR